MSRQHTSETTRNEYHVAVVEDEPGMRRLLRMLLESEGLVVRCFDCAESFLDDDEDIRFSCVVLDHVLPGINGLELFAELRRRGSLLPIVLISGNATVADAISTLRHGPSAFFEKPFANTELVASVLHLSTDWIEKQAKRDVVAARLANLSAREIEVLDSLVVGKKTTQIARELEISPSTVEKHRLHIFEKTGVESVVGLVHLVFNSGQHLGYGATGPPRGPTAFDNKSTLRTSLRQLGEQDRVTAGRRF